MKGVLTGSALKIELELRKSEMEKRLFLDLKWNSEIDWILLLMYRLLRDSPPEALALLTREGREIIHISRVLFELNFVALYATSSFCMVICVVCKKQIFQKLVLQVCMYCGCRCKKNFFPI